MRYKAAVLWALVLLLAGMFATRNLLAQTAAPATLVGTVTDQSNAIVPGATIKLTNVATGVS